MDESVIAEAMSMMTHEAERGGVPPIVRMEDAGEGPVEAVHNVGEAGH